MTNPPRLHRCPVCRADATMGHDLLYFGLRSFFFRGNEYPIKPYLLRFLRKLWASRGVIRSHEDFSMSRNYIHIATNELRRYFIEQGLPFVVNNEPGVGYVLLKKGEPNAGSSPSEREKNLHSRSGI